jgi:hypothetical protein
LLNNATKMGYFKRYGVRLDRNAHLLEDFRAYLTF